jgi:type VI secretion system secreted protein VgrG
MPATQENRAALINTPLGKDKLLLRRFSYHEQLGRLFRLEAELLSEDGQLTFENIVGENVTIGLDTEKGSFRYFNGTVCAFSQTGALGRYARYQATIVPSLWHLTRSADCRIFQKKSVPDIIKGILTDYGLTDVSSMLKGTYNPWEYCVQYRETDFNFVSRLMEQEGIYYFFQHDNGKHTLVLADDPTCHNPFTGYDKVKYRPEQGGYSGGQDLSDWTVRKEIQPGIYALNDFDFTKPQASLLAKQSITRQHSQSGFEIFDYPGEYVAQADGTNYSKVRLQELQAQFEVVQGSSDARGLAAGCTFTLEDHPRSDQNRSYLITSVHYTVETGEYEGGGGGGMQCSCSLQAIDAQQNFRSPRLTPKPIVQGPQTAFVVGPQGDEIHTDQYGQVKVQFHWDRYGNADQDSSCFIRVSQNWAGSGWGAICLPRIGQEVIVEFLEGDPDQPIVTGRVYNGNAMPPYPLPSKKTITGVKSNSSTGGQGFNEIRFEDDKGNEQIFIHGEKNMDIRVKNDRFETIKHDRHLTVENDRFEHVKNNRHETVDNDHKENIGNDRNLNVTGKEAKAVGGSLSLTVSGDVIEVFKGNHSEQVTSDHYLKGDNVVIEGMTSVTIKVGQSYIAIDSSGISLGTNGTIATSDQGGLSLQSQAQAQIQAPQVSVNGQATVTVQGGMVNINS